jgi:hypothetical protein
MRYSSNKKIKLNVKIKRVSIIESCLLLLLNLVYRLILKEFHLIFYLIQIKY